MKKYYSLYLLLLIFLLCSCTKPSKQSTNSTEPIDSTNSKVSTKESSSTKPLSEEEAKSIAKDLLNRALDFDKTLAEITSTQEDSDICGCQEDSETQFETQFVPLPENFKFKSFDHISKEINSIYTDEIAELYTDSYTTSESWFSEKEGQLLANSSFDFVETTATWDVNEAKIIYQSPMFLAMEMPFTDVTYNYDPETEENIKSNYTIPGLLHMKKTDNIWKLTTPISYANSVESSLLDENTVSRTELIEKVAKNIKTELPLDQYYFDFNNGFFESLTGNKRAYRLRLLTYENNTMVTKYSYFVDIITGEVFSQCQVENGKILNPDFQLFHPDNDDINLLVGFRGYFDNESTNPHEFEKVDNIALSLNLLSFQFNAFDGNEIYLIIPKYLEDNYTISIKDPDNNYEIMQDNIIYETFEISTTSSIVCNYKGSQPNIIIDYFGANGFKTSFEPQISSKTIPPTMTLPKGVKDITNLVYTDQN